MTNNTQKTQYANYLKKRNISDELAIVHGLISCVLQLRHLSFVVSFIYVNYHLANKDKYLART